MLLEMKDVVKRYGDLVAVDHVTMSIGEGEIFGLLGPNGAGKTTAINTILGLTRIDGGDVLVFGRNFEHHASEIKKQIGIVPQDIAVFEDLTAYENVQFFGRLYGLKGALLKDRIREALDFTGLWDRRKEFPKKFSGGMKRRLNIACAVVHQPRLIIMDEPTVGIDPQSRNHILQSVKALNQKGSTIIYTSHYMEEVEEICTRITIMDHGRIIAGGTKEALKAMVAEDQHVELEVSGVNFNLVDCIKGIDGVKDAAAEGRHITVTSVQGASNLSRILAAVSEAGQEVVSMNTAKPTLEMVFLTLTGRTLRD